jgi:hypothetical protein
LFKTTKVQAQAVENIGGISELNGSAQIFRDKPLDATLKFAIQSNDEAITSNGRMAITFLDDSKVTLTEHSQLLIDEYIYDPDPSKSKMALTFGVGTVRFLTSSLNKIDKQNITLKTPTANLAIRGTNFSVTVNEIGKTLVINLPYGLDNAEIGEIEVITAMGTVLLNKPFQATSVSVWESSPSKPVILDLNLNQINNMLIVTPPKKEVVIQEEETSKKANILDFNDLDIDYLDEDFLGKDELEFTELDINYLDTNYLEDLLNVLDALQLSDDEDALAEATGINLSGTRLGQDPDTQITTLVNGDIISLRRSVNDSVRLDLDGNDAYTVILIQDGVSNLVKINGGGDSIITITQSE